MRRKKKNLSSRCVSIPSIIITYSINKFNYAYVPISAKDATIASSAKKFTDEVDAAKSKAAEIEKNLKAAEGFPKKYSSFCHMYIYIISHCKHRDNYLLYFNHARIHSFSLSLTHTHTYKHSPSRPSDLYSNSKL